MSESVSEPVSQVMNHSFISLAKKPKEIKVEAFRIDYLIRSPKVEKLSLQPISHPTNQPVNQSHSTNHSIIQSVEAHSINPTIQSTNQSANQPTKHSRSQANKKLSNLYTCRSVTYLRPYRLCVQFM